MSGSGPEALPEVHKWSRGPPRFLGMVWRPSWMSGSALKTLLDVWEWSEDPPECPGVV